jgi:hypothetical protein
MQKYKISPPCNKCSWKEKQVTFLNLLKKTPNCFCFSLQDRHYNGITVHWKVMGENGQQLYSICELWRNLNLAKRSKSFNIMKKEVFCWDGIFLKSKICVHVWTLCTCNVDVAIILFLPMNALVIMIFY